MYCLILVMSCFMWSGALDSSDLLLSYSTISLSSPMTNILISTLKHKFILILAQGHERRIPHQHPQEVPPAGKECWYVLK